MENRLEEILKSIAEKKALVATDPGNVDPRVRSGFAANAQQAQLALYGLAESYGYEIANRLLLIEVEGAGAAEFAEHARAMDILAFDFRFLDKELAKRMRARRAGDTYTSTEHSFLLAELNALKGEFGMTHVPIPESNDPSKPTFGQPLETAIGNMLEQNYRGQLYTIALLREIQKAALQQEFTGKTLAVVIHNVNPELDTLVVPPVAYRIEAPANGGADFTKKELNKLRSRLKEGNQEKKHTKKETQGE